MVFVTAGAGDQSGVQRESLRIARKDPAAGRPVVFDDSGIHVGGFCITVCPVVWIVASLIFGVLIDCGNSVSYNCSLR